MSKDFSDKVGELFKSMIEVGFEFVNNNEDEIQKVFVFGSLEESIMFDCFYSIDKVIAKRHQINEHLQKKIDDSDKRQDALLRIGIEDLKAFKELCINYKEDYPNQVYLVYDAKKYNFTSDLVYDQVLIGSDKMATDLVDEWIAKISK